MNPEEEKPASEREIKLSKIEEAKTESSERRKTNELGKNIIKKLKTRIKSLTWQDWTALILTLIIFSVYLNLASSFQQVPSPVFGGDYYRDRGFVKNIVEGNPIWSDGFYVNEIQYYPYLIFAVQAGIVEITNFSVDQVFIYFPLLTVLLGALIWYFLGKGLFKNKTWGLITLASMFGITYFYGLKSSDFGLFVLVPLFLYLWLRYEQTENRKYAIWCGIVLGIIALVHGGRFLASISLLAISLVIFFIIDLIRTPETKEKLKLFKKYVIKYYLIFVIALIISLIFFLPLYLKYQMHSVNNVTIWGDTNINNLGLKWVWLIFKDLFFNTSNIFIFIGSLISLGGLIGLFFLKKEYEHKWILVIAAANLIALEHHLLTRPLLNTYFNPGKLELITYFAPLFFTFGVMIIAKSAEKIKIFSKSILALIFILFLLAPGFYINYKDYNSSQWIKYGQQENEYVKSLYSLADYLTLNLQRNETVLSNDESGFMLAMLSGRKVMLTRRTHASYYIDIDQRIAEAAVAMYGKNVTESKEILARYNVKYFYLDEYLLTYPMRVRPELKNYLKERGINFTEVYDRYDIALPLDETNGMNLLLIPPQKLNQEFMDLWKRVYQVKIDDQVAGELYYLKE